MKIKYDEINLAAKYLYDSAARTLYLFCLTSFESY